MMDGHRGQQFDRGADRAAQPHRRQFGQVERDAECQRHREDQRQDRGDQRAVDRDGGAEHLLHRVPVGRSDEAEAELAKRRQSADQQRQDQAAQQDQHEHAGEPGQECEDRIPDLVARGVPNVMPAGYGDGLLHARLTWCRGTSAFQAARTASFTLAGSGM